jgi:hypothetical protein
MMDNVMFGNPEDNMDKGENSNHGIERPLNMLIGCTNTETGLFSSQKANGIMGLYAKVIGKNQLNKLAVLSQICSIFYSDRKL